MPFKKIIIAAAIVCGISSFAQAQQNSYPPSQMALVPASRLKAAQDMLAATDLATQMNAMYNNIIEASSAQVPADKKAKFKEVMKSFLNKYMNYEALKADFAQIYAEEFTEQELKDITKFYLTPAGKKMNQKLALLTKRGMEMAQGKVQQHMGELQENIKAAFPNQ